MSSARDEILARIRKANQGTGPRREAAYAAIQRTYQQAGLRSAESRSELFIDRLLDYGSDVRRCAGNELAGQIAEVLAKRGKTRVLVPAGLPVAWQPVGIDFVRDDGLPIGVIDEMEAVLTGCALAIAITGTIVLRHSPAEGRRAITLIPDYHLCVVYENQIVETVPEGIREMSSFAVAPLTTISGSSATSDIEMTRVKGVHGPRILDVILVR